MLLNVRYFADSIPSALTTSSVWYKEIRAAFTIADERNTKRTGSMDDVCTSMMNMAHKSGVMRPKVSRLKHQ
jgi:hypothetical protein